MRRPKRVGVTGAVHNCTKIGSMWLGNPVPCRCPSLALYEPSPPHLHLLQREAVAVPAQQALAYWPLLHGLVQRCLVICGPRRAVGGGHRLPQCAAKPRLNGRAQVVSRPRGHTKVGLCVGALATDTLMSKQHKHNTLVVHTSSQTPQKAVRTKHDDLKLPVLAQPVQDLGHLLGPGSDVSMMHKVSGVVGGEEGSTEVQASGGARSKPAGPGLWAGSTP